MSKKINIKTGEIEFFIPINGKYYETTEEIHEVYYKMDRRERYLQERSSENELSFEALQEAFYPVEMKMLNREKTIEQIVMNDFIVEKVFNIIATLPEKDKWVIEEIFIKGKSVVEIAKEVGCSRTTIQSRKTRALSKIKKLIVEKNVI